MDAMHRHKVTLKTRLAGLTRASGAELPPTPPSGPQQLQDTQALGQILAECARLAQDLQTRDRRTLGDIARMSVELAAAIAERLVGAAIAADQQRLDRIVLG